MASSAWQNATWKGASPLFLSRNARVDESPEVAILVRRTHGRQLLTPFSRWPGTGGIDPVCYLFGDDPVTLAVFGDVYEVSQLKDVSYRSDQRQFFGVDLFLGLDDSIEA